MDQLPRDGGTVLQQPKGSTRAVTVIINEIQSVESAPEVEQAWLEEAERRLADYRAGKTQCVSAEAVFGPF